MVRRSVSLLRSNVCPLAALWHGGSAHLPHLLLLCLRSQVRQRHKFTSSLVLVFSLSRQKHCGFTTVYTNSCDGGLQLPEGSFLCGNNLSFLTLRINIRIFTVVFLLKSKIDKQDLFWNSLNLTCDTWHDSMFGFQLNGCLHISYFSFILVTQVGFVLTNIVYIPAPYWTGYSMYNLLLSLANTISVVNISYFLRFILKTDDTESASSGVSIPSCAGIEWLPYI